MEVKVKKAIEDYICRANNKIAELSTLAADLLEQTGCDCDISEYTSSILDINSSLFLLNKSWEDIENTFGTENYLGETYNQDLYDNILSFIDRYIVRYDMIDSSIIVFPGYNNVIINSDCCNGSESSGIPDGGGPGFYLTKNVFGDLVWERIDNCDFDQTFVSPSIDESSGPYEFTLSREIAEVKQIFINGQLLTNKSTYTHSGDKVVITSPTVLDSAVVSIFGNCGKKIGNAPGGSGIVDIYPEFYRWNDGDDYTFETFFPIGSVISLSINGVDYDPGEYMTYTEGEESFLVIDSVVELEEDDYVGITYTPYND